MGFAISTHDMERITSFEKAEAYYNATKTVRGYDKETQGVPLRADRAAPHQKRLIRLIAPDGAVSYACRLYSTNVVTFHSDGSIGLDLSYVSQSTALFADYFTPYQNCVATRNGFMVVSDRVGWHVVEKGRLVKAEDGSYVVRPEDSIPMCVKRVNKSVAAKARKQIAPFLAYVKTLEALGPVAAETVLEMSNNYLTGIIHLGASGKFKMATDEAQFPALAAWLYRRTGWGTLESFSISHARAKDEMTPIAYAHCDAYYFERLPMGTLHPEMRMVGKT